MCRGLNCCYRPGLLLPVDLPKRHGQGEKSSAWVWEKSGEEKGLFCPKQHSMVSYVSCLCHVGNGTKHHLGNICTTRLKEICGK